MNEEVTEVSEEQIQKAKLKAMKLLEGSDKTELQLRRRLEEGGFPPLAVSEAVAYVRSFHYIDDTRFAEQYVRSRGLVKSRIRICFELREKGVPEEIIEKVLQQSEEDGELDEAEAVKRQYQKKYGKKQEEADLFPKAVRYFSGKGYSFEVIRKGIALALEENAEKDENGSVC